MSFFRTDNDLATAANIFSSIINVRFVIYRMHVYLAVIYHFLIQKLLLIFIHKQWISHFGADLNSAPLFCETNMLLPVVVKMFYLQVSHECSCSQPHAHTVQAESKEPR